MFDVEPKDGVVMAIRARANGKLVCVDQNLGGVLIADRDEVNVWEEFIFKD
jgi:hypothetical protein